MRLVSLLVALGLGLCACGGSSRTAEANPTVRTAVQALCKMRAGLSDSVETSRRIFLDEAHDELHVLARRVTAKDRKVGAQLLEAMQRVEVAFATDTKESSMVDFQEGLITASNSALETIDLDPVRCA